ncbi:MAG: GMC family oxidoreductase [Pseudomonadota bacterium]|nr:GMC family oxidoreductase [Pseudomonadota bacterium]
MFPTLTRTEAQARHWDVVIAGTSFSAMFFLQGLPKGLSVLLVEKGPHLPHDTQIATGFRNLETVAMTNTSGHEKEWVFHSLLGGNSNCWWACTPRFHPSDFRMQTLYGVGEDWPIDYDTLEPFYQEVERAMDINGGGSDAQLPRSAPFPYPAHLPSRSDRRLRAHSDLWWAQPSARANGGDRAGCCANGVCSHCPIDSKYTVLNSIDRLAYDGAQLLMETEVRAVTTQAGRATGVVLRDAQGEAEITADLVALGANAVFNAAILLRSDVDHPKLGRGLNEQMARSVVVDGPGLGYFGGTSITGHGYALYDGAHRATHSGVLLEVYNAPSETRPEPGRWTERVRLKLIAEDLPRDDNRVILDGDEPLIEWRGHDSYASDGLDWGVEAVQGILPEGLVAVAKAPIVATEKHAMGTHRFGSDPQRHVCDDLHRVYGVDGLFALGSGVFPTTSPANPTLTLSALALRAGRSVT